jgi:hypothetical protein
MVVGASSKVRLDFLYGLDQLRERAVYKIGLPRPEQQATCGLFRLKATAHRLRSANPESAKGTRIVMAMRVIARHTGHQTMPAGDNMML